MKRLLTVICLLVMTALFAPVLSSNVHAEDVKMVGVISKIKLAADGKSAVATLKDNKSGEEFKIDIDDDLTLDKFKDKRIVEGDEIRTLFDKKADGKNHSKMFKKTAGC